MKTSLTCYRAMLLAGALLLATTSPGATVTWSGAGADNNLSTAGNWSGGVAPAATDDIVFTGSTRTTPVAATPQYLSITFDVNANPFVFSGTSITTGTTAPAGGSVTNLSAFTQTFGCSLNPRAGTLMASNGDIVLNGGFNVGNSGNSSGRNITVDGPMNVIVNSVLTGSGTDTSAGGQLTKNGAGALFLNGSSPAWTGKIILNFGPIVVTNNNALGATSGSTSITSSQGAGLNDGRVLLSNNITVAEPFTLGARQQGSVNFPHIVNAADTNTLTGTITLTTGGARYNLQSDAGKLIVAGTINASGLTSGTRELRVAGASEGELRGPISGGIAAVLFNFMKEGTGLWTLTGTNSNSGNTYVNSGRLALGPQGKITGSTNIFVAAGAVYDVSAVLGGYSVAGNQILSGSGMVTGSVTVVAGGKVSPGGGLAVGTLTFANDLLESATATNYFDLGAGNDLINVAGNLEPNGAAIVISSVNRLVPGTYRLFNYSGSKTTNFGSVISDTHYTLSLDESTAGQVNLVVSGSPSSLTWSGGTAANWDIGTSASWNGNTALFLQADAVTFDDSAATNTVNLGVVAYPSAVTVNTATNYLLQGAGRIGGTTGLTKTGNGSLTVNTSNDFSGVVNITGGTLIAGNASALGLTNAGTTVSGTGTLDVNNKNLGLEPITISGSGVGGVGAVVNSGAEQQNAVRILSLADDAAIGGLNRWDVRGAGGNSSFSGLLDLAGHTLTKTGTNKISVVDSLVENAGNFSIVNGILALTRSKVSGPGVIDLSTNILQIENGTTGYVFKPLLSRGGRLQVVGAPFTLEAPVTNIAGLTIDNAVDLALTNELTGAGPLTKVSNGTLTFQRPAAHAGATTLSAGTTVLGADSGLPNSSGLAVDAGATLDASLLPNGLVLNSGQSLSGSGMINGNVTVGAETKLVPGSSPGTLTFFNNLSLADASASFELGSDPFNPAANDLVTVYGGLNLAGVTTVKIVPLAALNNVNAYTLFQYSSFSGTAANLNVVSDSRYTFSVVDPATTPGTIQVQVNGTGTAATLTWRGNDPANPTLWNTKTTPNWLNGAVADSFYLGDAVVFDDSAAGTTVNLVGTLQPSTIAFNNAGKNYSLGGAGSLLAGSLSVAGAGTTTVANSAGNILANGLAVSSGKLVFNNAGVNNFGTGVSLNGGTLLLANPSGNTLGAVNATGGDLIVGNPGVNAFSQLTVNGGNVLVTNNVANTFGGIELDAGALTFEQPLNLALNAPLTGVGALTKQGTNTLTLSGANSGFGGTIQVNAGTLRAGNAAGLGSGSGANYDGTTIASGASLDVNGYNLANELITVSGSGVNGQGAIINTGAGQNNALHDVALTGHTVFGGPNRWDIRTNTSGLANLSTGGNSYNITKIGANQVSLVSANVDAALGDIDVQQGGFSYEGTSTSLGEPSRTLTVASNAFFLMWGSVNPLDKRIQLQGGSQFRSQNASNTLWGPVNLAGGNANFQVDFTLTATNEFSGPGTLVKAGAATLILSASNSFAGGTTVNEGMIQANADHALGTGPVTILGTGNATRVQLGANVTVTNLMTISAGANPTANHGSIEANGGGLAVVNAPVTVTTNTAAGGHFGATGAGSILRLAQGVLVTNSSQAISFRLGTMEVARGGNYSSASIGQDTLRLVGDNGLPTGVVLTVAASAAGTFDLNGYNQTVGALSRGGNFTAIVSNSAATASVLTVGQALDNTFSGVIGGNLSVVKVNTNTLTLNGANTYSGATTVQNGTLLINGLHSGTSTLDVKAGAKLGGNGAVAGAVLVEANGLLAPGTTGVGILSVSNTLTLNGTNLMEVTRTGAVITNDLVRGVTTLAYGGTLQLALAGDALSAGDALKLYDASVYVGAFSSIVPAKPGNGLVWNTSTLTVDGTLRVSAEAAPAIVSSGSLPDGNFHMTLSGTLGQPYKVWASTNIARPLTDWTILESGNIPTVPYVFTDLSATNHPTRFYIISTP